MKSGAKKYVLIMKFSLLCEWRFTYGYKRKRNRSILQEKCVLVFNCVIHFGAIFVKFVHEKWNFVFWTSVSVQCFLCTKAGVWKELFVRSMFMIQSVTVFGDGIEIHSDVQLGRLNFVTRRNKSILKIEKIRKAYPSRYRDASVC